MRNYIIITMFGLLAALNASKAHAEDVTGSIYMSGQIGLGGTALADESGTLRGVGTTIKLAVGMLNTDNIAFYGFLYGASTSHIEATYRGWHTSCDQCSITTTGYGAGMKIYGKRRLYFDMSLLFPDVTVDVYGDKYNFDGSLGATAAVGSEWETSNPDVGLFVETSITTAAMEEDMGLGIFSFSFGVAYGKHQ